MQIQNEQLLLNRYRVLEQRATGGFGQVVIAWDRRLTRRVAIKCMPLNDASTGAQTMEEALQEARTSCLLAHPNIVIVHDFEVEDNVAYLVMEYIDGLNLEELLARVEGGCLTFEETAHVLDSVALALSYAHEQGVLHLDIKPANIMIDRNGHVKLTDFGMATLASASGYADSRGGTIGYMPPEQILGNLVDERTDIFALGCVIWRCLTAKSPFISRDAESSLTKIEKGPRPKLSKLEPQLGGFVESYLLKTLAYAPQDRPVNCEEFADALVDVLGDVHEGKMSLKDLIDQREDDTFDNIELLDKQAVLENIPHALSYSKRLYAAILTISLGWWCAPALSITAPLSQMFIMLMMGAISAFVPSIGALIGMIVFGISLVATWYTQTQALIALSSIVLLLGTSSFLWYLIHDQDDATNGLVSCLFLHSWWGSIPFCAVTLSPLKAGIISALSCCIWQASRALLTISPNLPLSFVHICTTSSTWIQIICVAITSALLSFILRRNHFRHSFGLINGALLIVISCSFITFCMENTLSGLLPHMISLSFAVILFELLGIATILLGPAALSQEADK